MDFQAISYIVISIAVGFVIFLILRELFCWYWKINRLVELQEQAAKTLLEIYKLQKANTSGLNDSNDEDSVSVQ